MTTNKELHDLALRYVQSLDDRGWFDICTVRKALELLGVEEFDDTPEWAFMRPLHCVNYDRMGQTVKDRLLECVLVLTGFKLAA